MKYLKTFESRGRRLNDCAPAKRTLSKVYNIVDDIILWGRGSDEFYDFIVEFDDFMKYANEHNGSFAGNKFESLEQFKRFVENSLESVISPLIYVAPFWQSRTISDIVDFKDVYSDTLYVKLLDDITDEEIDELFKSLEADEIGVKKSKSGEKYLRIWWD